ncbi:MAG TPA: GNAT family N-acetyltransferase [Gemmatimonadaceae bacterium]
MSGYFAQNPRPLGPEDSQGTRVLLMGALGVTPYIDRALEVLEHAERGNDPESRALVIARDGTVAGLALFGTVAGTQHAARLYTAVVAPGVSLDDVGGRLMRAVADTMRGTGARFLIAEMPDDPAIGSVLALLREHGFREEARVPDFYREGVALAFLRMEL